MEQIILSVICGLVAVGFYVVGGVQLCEKGFLLNNAYLYATKEEREAMNKTPYYRQSGVVFMLLGTVFALQAADALLQTKWLFWCVIALVVATLLYAVISSVVMEKNRNSK